MDEVKLTEDETVKYLLKYLESQEWKIISYCLGQKRGYDIVAERENERIIVEVKGAKANDYSPTKRRKYFDSGQIKDHLGKAIVKSMETQNSFPNYKIGIAHPDDPYIRKTIGNLIKNVNKLGIIHFWVKSKGKVIVEE